MAERLTPERLADIRKWIGFGITSLSDAEQLLTELDALMAEKEAAESRSLQVQSGKLTLSNGWVGEIEVQLAPRPIRWHGIGPLDDCLACENTGESALRSPARSARAVTAHDND